MPGSFTPAMRAGLSRSSFLATSLKAGVSTYTPGWCTPFLNRMKRCLTSGAPGMSLNDVMLNLKWKVASAQQSWRCAAGERGRGGGGSDAGEGAQRAGAPGGGRA